LPQIGNHCFYESEFIEEIKKKIPEDLFLLIDETQTLVGEDLGIDDYEENLKEYWQFLNNLQQAARDQLYRLHVFHGLSTNSAGAINKVGKIPALQHFTKNIFSLKSLDEKAQWEMICDHIHKALNDKSIQPSSLIKRGVNRCLNELTGGNPRFVLDLMRMIFYKAQSQGLDKISGSICYQTLCDTPRYDASGQHFFDRFSINEVLEQLKSGKTFERNIATLLQERRGYIFGEWSGIEQDVLADYNLTATKIRLKCDSLSEPIILFDQLPGQTNFILSHKFLNLIRVKIQKTLTETDDRDLLLRLQMAPEELVSLMIGGLQRIMGYNGFHGQFRELQTIIPFRIFVTSLGGARLSENIKVGLAVFKGEEIPQDVFDKIVAEIEEDRCTIIIFIEDAFTCHDQSDSSFQAFKGNYNGDIDLEKRFIFINGTDPSGKEFDEDFFVRLVKTGIQQDEAKNWYERLQIDQRLKKIEEDCIHCPDLNERTLLEELFKKDRSFKIGEIRALKVEFDWVNRERLAKLGLYLNRTGTCFTPIAIEKVGPIKFILGKLNKPEIVLTESEVESFITTKYIRTGASAAIQVYVKWVLSLLVEHNKVAKVDGRFSYKDLDRELRQLKNDYDQKCQIVKGEISRYERAGIEVRELENIKNEEININQRIEDVMIDNTIEVKIVEHKHALDALNKFTKNLGDIPKKAHDDLHKQLGETNKKIEEINERTSWPFEDTVNPYKHTYGLGEIRELLEKLEDQIKQEIPMQKRCRQEIMFINKRLYALGSLLEGEITSDTYKLQHELDGCIFNIFNAIKDGKPGKVTLHF